MSTYQELQDQITKRREELAAQNPEVDQEQEEEEQGSMTLIETLSTDQNIT